MPLSAAPVTIPISSTSRRRHHRSGQSRDRHRQDVHQAYALSANVENLNFTGTGISSARAARSPTPYRRKRQRHARRWCWRRYADRRRWATTPTVVDNTGDVMTEACERWHRYGENNARRLHPRYRSRKPDLYRRCRIHRHRQRRQQHHHGRQRQQYPQRRHRHRHADRRRRQRHLHVDDAGDTITEAASGGTDAVKTTATSYTLGVEIENLTYTGTGNFIGSGNALANTITGGAGDDTLDGGAGADKLVGGSRQRHLHRRQCRRHRDGSGERRHRHGQNDLEPTPSAPTSRT